ncbi:hypothetical protein [Brachybacterium sp. UNK5269]|uniref:hypothetical protein n=1 Tax=Brachybacterium sp. UNK5269 TaxID=3408576 RepID=UPI003BAEB694
MIRRPDPSLLDLYDALLLDLDGTLMHGSQPIPHAAAAVQTARDAGRTVVFATNNASRTPAQAAEHLAVVGVPARAEEFVTSPRSPPSCSRSGSTPGRRCSSSAGPASPSRSARWDSSPWTRTARTSSPWSRAGPRT